MSASPLSWPRSSLKVIHGTYKDVLSTISSAEFNDGLSNCSFKRFTNVLFEVTQGHTRMSWPRLSWRTSPWLRRRRLCCSLSDSCQTKERMQQVVISHLPLTSLTSCRRYDHPRVPYLLAHRLFVSLLFYC